MFVTCFAEFPMRRKNDDKLYEQLSYRILYNLFHSCVNFLIPYYLNNMDCIRDTSTRLSSIIL